MTNVGNAAGRSSGGYVLVTAAHNEEMYIERTLQSVVAQSVKPLRWVIVNDRSTDTTETIIKRYQADHGFIMILNITGDDNRNFGAQVRAINNGVALLKDMGYEFIGNLDADISFGPKYYECLMQVFHGRPVLGIAGGMLWEQYGGVFRPRKANTIRSVPHAVQLFRRQCYEGVGGYKPLRYGGPDWYAEVSARMNGWEVQTIQELQVFHHRPTLGAEGSLPGAIRQGLMDHSLGSRTLFEMVKCARRVRTKPYVVYSLFRLSAFLWATLTMKKREATSELMEYLRNEQKTRLRKSFINVASRLFGGQTAQGSPSRDRR